METHQEAQDGEADNQREWEGGWQEGGKVLEGHGEECGFCYLHSQVLLKNMSSSWVGGSGDDGQRHKKGLLLVMGLGANLEPGAGRGIPGECGPV